ncbi:MAG: TonB-dependent receptor [Pseudomonadota bacterium]
MPTSSKAPGYQHKILTASSTIAMLAALEAGNLAYAQESQERPLLEEVVVTGTVAGRSQIESAVAVTQVSGDLIQEFQPISEADLFRLLPGIQTAGTVGPGGNANIAVRGLPVATGGSPFVQIQEDGLPTVLFGDIQFGNNDYWTNFDATVDAVEALRGGTAGTFASQAPGAVINYISRTGEEEGGMVRLKGGLGFDEMQVDFRLGGPISNTVRYHIGGYFRDGEGPLDSGSNVIDSLQLKGNITKEFADGSGYFRVNAKFADTQEPNYTGAPFNFSSGGSSPGSASAFPGFDGLTDSAYSALNQSMQVLTPSGFQRAALDGITTEQVAIGFELDRALDNTWTINNKFRYQDISGAFANPFFGVTPTASVLGSELSINGTPYASVAEIRYANGPNAGQTFNDPYLDNNAIFRTEVGDIGSFVNDLKVTGMFDFDSGTLTALVGYFYMDQTIAANWQVNRGNREVSGDNAASLELFDSAGNALSQAGISGYNNNWGSCCSRDYDLAYVNSAPYAALEFDNSYFNVDASVRFDTIDATGSTFGPGDEFFVDPNGAVVGTSAEDYVTGEGYITAMLPTDPLEVLDYSEDYTSWTIGGLYKLTGNTSIFIRTSQGNRFNADRQTYAGNINGDGSLTQAGRTSAVDEVNQTELGIKHRGAFGEASYSIEVTLLQADFSQNTFEIDGTGTRCPGGAPTCVLSNEFESEGFEVYGTLNWDRLSLIGTGTYTDAQVKGAGASSFSDAERIPEFQYSMTANYDLNEMFSGGFSLSGQTEIINGGRTWEGVNTISGYVRVRPIENIILGLDGYNLLDDIALREGGAIVDESVTPVVGTGGSVLGRTFRAFITYEF